MEALYDNLAEYYVFDKSKYTLEEFFTDLKAFKDSFYVCNTMLFYKSLVIKNRTNILSLFIN